MSSTVYLVDEGHLFPTYRTRPFNVRWVNNTLCFFIIKDDLAGMRRNQRIVSSNDKLWEAIGKLFQKQSRYLIRISFKDTSPGKRMSIRLTGPFLKKLRRVYKNFKALKLNLRLRRQSKSWSIDIALNTIRQGKVLRIVHSERSQLLFNRIAIVGLPDLKMSVKLTTRVKALHILT